MSATLSLAPAKAESGKWAHEESDLTPDASIVWGKLDNGFRYAIRPNQEPPGRVSLRLYIDAGSLMENDDQQGLAHFLEHMAFNGTKNFPPGEMVEYFQRLGMGFGADTNAHTSFKETVYKLELPEAKEELLRDGMQLFRDYADEMLLLPAEIDRERGVIMSEKLSRDSASYRTMVEGFKFSLPDSLISNRLPIGEAEVIENAPRERFSEFYQKYYTADRMVLVAVGDVAPELVESLAREFFDTLPKNESPVSDPDLGTVTVGGGLRAKLQTEMEMPYTSIGIEVNKPYEKRRDGIDSRLSDLVRGLADQIMDRRFEILAKQEGAPILQANLSNGAFLHFVDSSECRLVTKPEMWEAALALGEQELRKAMEFGFTEAELEEAKANVRNQYEQRADQEETRKSRDLADRLVGSLGDLKVFTHPDDDLPRVAAALDQVTAEMVDEAFREDWGADEPLIFIGGNLELEDGDTAIASAWMRSSEVAVTAPIEEATAEFAYTEFGEPGEIVSSEHIDDLGLSQFQFANGVKANVLPTPYEDKVVQVSFRFGGGKLSAPLDQPGLISFADGVFPAGGLGQHSADDLTRLFAGKSVSAAFSVGDDAFVLSGQTDGDDLLAQLQLLTAYLTDPGYREEGERQFKKSIEPMYGQIRHTAEGAFQAQVPNFLRGGDSRFGFPEESVMASRTTAELKAWLSEALESGALEVSLVGDVDVDAAKEALAATVGSLGQRREKADYTEARKIDFPEGEEKDIRFQSDIAKVIVSAYWPTEDIWDVARARRLGALGDVFRDRLRLKIREELGDAYSPVAYHSPSDTFEGFGFLAAIVTLAPEKADSVAKVLQEIAETLVEEGTTADELERVTQPMLSKIRQMRRDNGYWMNSVVGSSQEFPQRLEWSRSFVSDYESITVEEVNALAKQYLKPENMAIAVVKPND